LPKKPKFTEGEIHELRLALALNIDPATRLLSTSLSYLDAPLDPTSPEFERLSPFVWKDSAWKKVEREHCEYMYNFQAFDRVLPLGSIYHTNTGNLQRFNNVLESTRLASLQFSLQYELTLIAS
jgi:hypothetical protein